MLYYHYYKKMECTLQGWREVPMFSTPSRAAPLGGAWLSAVVPATGDPARGPPQLEFVVASGAPAAWLCVGFYHGTS